MTSPQMLKELQKLMDQLNNNFDVLYNAAASAADKQLVADSLTAAKDAYFQALANGITDLNPVVQTFAGELKSLNTQIAAQLNATINFVTAMGLVSDAIKTGAAIVTLAMV